ncbi:MAG: hypothetical protein JOS17DRAFT_81089 [Linnemannia elongata]|nr:MAG: hypothetical protein JOS17DRAFT_81089 [Linnemannia elongata]
MSEQEELRCDRRKSTLTLLFKILLVYCCPFALLRFCSSCVLSCVCLTLVFLCVCVHDHASECAHTLSSPVPVCVHLPRKNPFQLLRSSLPFFIPSFSSLLLPPSSFAIGLTKIMIVTIPRSFAGSNRQAKPTYRDRSGCSFILHLLHRFHSPSPLFPAISFFLSFSSIARFLRGLNQFFE